MKNVNAGQVQNDKSVAIEELGGYLSGVDCQRIYSRNKSVF